MNQATLEQLLQTEADGGIHTEYRMAVQEVDEQKGVRVIVHPFGVSGVSLDFWVKGNSLSPLELDACPHAWPFQYCSKCVESPCPIGIPQP